MSDRRAPSEECRRDEALCPASELAFSAGRLAPADKMASRSALGRRSCWLAVLAGGGDATKLVRAPQGGHRSSCCAGQRRRRQRRRRQRRRRPLRAAPLVTRLVFPRRRTMTALVAVATAPSTLTVRSASEVLTRTTWIEMVTEPDAIRRGSGPVARPFSPGPAEVRITAKPLSDGQRDLPGGGSRSAVESIAWSLGSASGGAGRQRR